MKQILKRIIPSRILRLLRSRHAWHLVLDTRYDSSRYARFSSVIHYGGDEERLRSIITALYHNIEKGLSLPAPRPGFGKDNINRLIDHLDQLIALYGPRDYLTTPLGALDAYLDFNRVNGSDDPALANRIANLRSRMAAYDTRTDQKGGVKKISKATLTESVNGGLNFLLSRTSCRQFTDEPVSRTMIENAVLAAQQAPSVCNRQSGRVHVFDSRADIDRILELQGGARGFGQAVTVLFCITVDLRAFSGSGERYQGWIDGGMFAMNLALGLHSQGLGSCCLNWSKNRAEDRRMRDLIGLPPEESIIMFMAAGHIPDQCMVAKSVRKNLTEILTYRTLAQRQSS